MTSPDRIRLLNEALSKRCIPHPRFDAAFRRGQELLELQDLGMPGSGILIHGPAGIGKTTLTKALLNFGQKKYGEDAAIRTQLTGGATIKSILSNLLYAFGDPRSEYGTQSQLIQRLSSTISARQCRLIIIDEIQHLVPGGAPSRRIIDNILNAFKILDDTRVSFLLAGLDETLNLWNADAQIRSRFQTRCRLKPFSYPADRKIWLAIVNKYLVTIEDHGLTVSCANLSDRLFSATKGAMRPLVLILMSAAVQACKGNRTTITVEDLRKATASQIDEHDGLQNAFDIELEEIQEFARNCHTMRKLAPVSRRLNEALSQ